MQRDRNVKHHGYSSVAPKCRPVNGWTVRQSPAHRGVLLGHEKGRKYEPRPHSVKYIIASDKESDTQA